MLWPALAAGAQTPAEPAPAKGVAKGGAVAEAAAPAAGSAVLIQDEEKGPAEAPKGKDLLDLPLESLSATPVRVSAPSLAAEVTSVTGQRSSVGRSPAAVFVITNEMIRRSGATSIPEALRLAPGLQVAKINAHTWTIAARGFNGEFFGAGFNSKLLVQIDGRSVYSPLFAGVYWDVQDVLLEDVERIEVIRGPGATVWGANAVNGIISIITKSAKDTQGVFVQGGGGSEERGFSSFRVGGHIGDDLNYRIYGKWFEKDASFNARGAEFDDWRQGRVGFRTDWAPTCWDTVTLQGDYYRGRDGIFSVFPRDETVSGGNVLGRWTHELGEKSGTALQFYYDRADRRDATLDQKINTYDLDFRHHFPVGCRHSVVWGAGYRVVSDSLTSFVPTQVYVPSARTYDTVSTFVQDEIALVPDKLFLTLGTKLENNDFTHFEYQPSARLLWSPETSWAAWAAVSRAVRTPARFEHDLRAGLLLFSKDFQAEELIAYEAGFRKQPVEWFSWDVAGFFNRYRNLQSLRFVPPIAFNANDNYGEAYGFEISGKLDISKNWRLTGWYSFVRVEIHPGALALNKGPEVEGSTPHNQVFLMSSWNLTCNLDFDLMGRYVDNLPAQNVPNYFSLDARLAWRPTRHLELSVVGQNLLDARHPEFAGNSGIELERAVYGTATLRW
jgi:iron complex outermembrane receptor protein